jgi:hypothetical protein
MKTLTILLLTGAMPNAFLLGFLLIAITALHRRVYK